MVKRGGKIREIDYTHKEFIEELNVSERTFRNQFGKMLQMYGLEKESFKKKNEEHDDYFWPIEWAQLAAVLIRTFPDNPYYRSNARLEAIIANDILTYYQSLIDETENNFPKHLKNYTRSLPGYLSALKLTNSLLPRLISQNY